MITSAQVVVKSVTTTDNSPSQDYTRPDDQTTLLHVTPGFKPFTVHLIISIKNNKRDSRNEFLYICMPYKSQH